MRPRIQGDGTPLPWATAASFKTPAAGSLTLQITAPLNESVVSTSSVIVMGKTAPGAYVTVEDKFVIADASGGFSATIALTDGSVALGYGDAGLCADAATVNNRDERGVTRALFGNPQTGPFFISGAEAATLDQVAPPRLPSDQKARSRSCRSSRASRRNAKDFCVAAIATQVP